MLLQNSEVLADAKRTAAEGYAPLKRALARFQQLLREEGRDTAPAPESSRWLLAGQTKTQEPAAAQPAPQPQPQPHTQGACLGVLTRVVATAFRHRNGFWLRREGGR